MFSSAHDDQDILYYGSDTKQGVIHIIDRVLELPMMPARTVADANLTGVMDLLIKIPKDPKTDASGGLRPDWTLSVSPFPHLHAFENI